jgi:hypothetical protein
LVEGLNYFYRSAVGTIDSFLISIMPTAFVYIHASFLPIYIPCGKITVEKGKLGDIIAVDGDPIKAISAMERVVFVIKNGAVYRQK